MLRIQFNNGSPLRLNLPRADQKQAVLELAQAFLAFETTLPEADRTPFTARLATAVPAALTAQDVAFDQEATRVAASEALKRSEQAARATLRQIRNLLTGHFAATPELAQGWGFMVRQTGRSAGKILMPRKRSEMIACLNEYIEAENGRPEAERFSQPPLATVTALRDDLVQQRQSRNSARHSRLQENGRKETLIEQIYNDLRLALSYLMLIEFDGEPDRNLAQWGFEVVARSPYQPREEMNGEPREEDETVPEPA
ncbi:MAG: hypothetical protein H6656_01665 [Ardenticatenaceae bacterium]|nr:hypothetical protein [Ardenticatenaceae bacterium]